MSCDTEPETLREYVSIEDARSYLHDHMREMRFIKTSSLIAVVLLAETMFIEKRVYSADGSYTVETLYDVYCPIPQSFDRVNMVFLTQAEKDITDDDDDGRNDDFD